MILPVLRKKVTTRKDRTTRESTRKAAWPAGGEQREGVKTHGQVLLSGLRVEVISKRHERISVVYLNVPRSQSGEVKKGNLHQRPALSHWFPGRLGVSSHLLCEMLRQQENVWGFQIRNIKCGSTKFCSRIQIYLSINSNSVLFFLFPERLV